MRLSMSRFCLHRVLSSFVCSKLCSNLGSNLGSAYLTMPPKKRAAAASNGTSASTTKKQAIDVKAWASPEPVKVENGSKSRIEKDAKTGQANGKSPPLKKAKKEVEVKKGATKAKVEKPKIKNINYSTMPSLLPDNWYENSKSKIFVGAHVSIGG